MTNETKTIAQPDAKADASAAPDDRKGHDRMRHDRQRIQSLLTLGGFIVLAAGIAYLWTRPVPMPAMPPLPLDQSGVVAALKSQVSSLQSAVYALDARERADVAALHEAIANIPTNPASTGQVQTGVAVASQPAAAASDAAIADLKAQVDRLQASQSLPSAAAVTALSSRVDAVAQKQGTDDDALRQQIASLKAQIGQLDAQAQVLTQSTRALPQLSLQSDRVTRLLRAEAALSAGAPLGDIPNAPAALSRFATAAPPTDAGLVLSYPDAARAAAQAGGPPADRGGFWHGIWMRVQTLITVRQGDRVLVGDPTNGILAHAQRLLVAGDLPGALAVLKTLQGPAAEAMAGWIAQAQSLVDARQALAQMAEG